MGAVKAYLEQSIESVFGPAPIEMNGDVIYTADIAFDLILDMVNGDDERMRSYEMSWFGDYHVDTADFLTDWAGRVSSAIAVFSGLATTDEGCVGNYFDILSYTYHHSPRSVAKALRTFGLTDAAVQGIIYMLAGRLLDASDQLRIVRFDYLAK